jgi:hypothetical protein
VVDINNRATIIMYGLKGGGYQQQGHRYYVWSEGWWISTTGPPLLLFISLDSVEHEARY